MTGGNKIDSEGWGGAGEMAQQLLDAFSKLALGKKAHDALCYLLAALFSASLPPTLELFSRALRNLSDSLTHHDIPTDSRQQGLLSNGYGWGCGSVGKGRV